MESDEELDLNLEVLNEQERNIIVNVLKRDEVLRKVQDFKIGELKVEIQNIRQKGIMRGDDDISRMCVRCRAELGRLFNRGSLCPQCHFRVCLMCQEKLFNGSILCTLCYKLRQLKWLTGEWGSGGHTRLRRWSSGADLVKSTLSLPKNILIGNTRADDDSIIPGNTRLSQQSEPNGSALPSENNDDDKVHYPQDSDRRKLTELFDSFFAKHPESATREKHSRSVKHISTRIYEDSDSSSTASDAETPFVNIPSAQSFTVLKDDDTPLAHSFPSAHSLPANAISTPVNRGRFVDGTADFTGSEKKKVHAPKLSFSDASRPSFDASEDRSSFLASPIIKNQSHNMNNSLQDSVFSQSDSKSEFPFGPRQTGAHACLTASEAVMAMKMAKQLESTPVQSNSALPMHDGRTESPTECTMESLPSSHASSPISVRNARLSSSEMKTKQESSDTDSLSKISQDGEFSGTESLPREGPDADDFVVEQISKVHFQRMSRKAAQCSVPSSTHKKKVPVVKMFPSAGSDGSASLEDSGLVSEASHATTPEHQRTDSVNSQSSIPSVTLSIATDHSHEEDDIDSIVASHRSLYSSVGGSHGNLLTTIADSRESIMSFYSNAGDVDYGKIPITGDILFGLDYNYRTGSLEIMIKKCQDIAPVDTKHNRSDPYVKTYLLPDKTRSGKRKTKIKKHTLNPTFDEVLRYVISKSELESRTLWVSVWHNDRFGRNDFLGEITINFDYYKFTDSTPKWYQLHERMDNQHHSVLAYKGDIILSVRYVTSDKLLHEASGSPLPSRKKAKKSNPACSQGELQVLIKEARNLTAVRSNGYSDPFCKGFLLPEAKHKSNKQKTPVIKKDCSPIWNYTLIFDDVSLEELRECCLELSIWDQDRLLGNDFLGGLRLNLGSGSSHGKHVDWMDARGEEISIWQSMLDRPNTWIDGALILRPSMNKRRY